MGATHVAIAERQIGYRFIGANVSGYQDDKRKFLRTIVWPELTPMTLDENNEMASV